MFAEAETRPDDTPHPFTPTFQPAAISSLAFPFRRGHQPMGSDYGQMFSPRNNLGYLTSVQGNQSCEQLNNELAESFIQMQNNFFEIVEAWPHRDGKYISKIGPETDMQCEWWEGEFQRLVAETIDYSKMNMLYDSTARIALDTCSACLVQDIPRDSIFRIIWELRQVLDPGVEYDDWCRNAPDLSDEDETYEQYATRLPRGMTASSSHGYYVPDNDPRSPGTAGISDIDSELNFNVVFDD